MSQPASAPPLVPERAPAKAPTAPTVPHRWRFYRAGGLDQVRLDRAEDLEHLAELDQKLWVALSCPTRGLELDPRTLELLDSDRDGRVRAPEVLAALRLCAARLRSLESLVAGDAALPLADLDPAKPDGQILLGAARRVLAHLGKPDAAAVTPDDVADLTRVWEKTRFNGDGVVPPDAADDPATRQLLADAIACTAPVPDRSGKPGLDASHLDLFFEAVLVALAATRQLHVWPFQPR